MGKKRRQYTKEFKIEAVRLIIEEGRPISDVARELGTAQSLLHRWKKKSEEGYHVLIATGRWPAPSGGLRRG